VSVILVVAALTHLMDDDGGEALTRWPWSASRARAAPAPCSRA